MSSWSIAVPVLREEYNLSTTLIQLGAGVLLLGYGTGNYIQGRIIPKHGWKKVLAPVMIAFVASQIFIPYSQNYWMVLILRFIQGWGLVTTLTMTSVNSWFPPEERGLAIGVLLSMIAGGVAIGGLLTGHFITMYGWKYCFHLIAIVVIINTVIYFVALGRLEPPSTSEEEAEKSNLEDNSGRESSPDKKFSVYKLNVFWILAFASFILFFQVYGMRAILGDYLNHIGYTAEAIGTLVFANGAAGIISTLFGGTISDRWVEEHGALKSRGYTMALIGFLGTVIASLLVPALALSGFIIAALGIAFVGATGPSINGPLFSLPADLLGPIRGGEVVGLMLLIGSIGGFVSPWLISWIASVYGWLTCWVALGLIMIPGVVLGFIIPHLDEKNLEEEKGEE